MLNQPFSRNNTHIVHQSGFTSVPENFNCQNTIVSPDQHRKMFDNLFTTSINRYPTSGFIAPRPQCHSNTVTFTFNSDCPQMQPPCQTFPPPCPPPSFNEMQNRNIQNLLQMQGLFRVNPNEFKFHLNQRTSTEDLDNLRGRADFRTAGEMMRTGPYWLNNTPPRINPRKLVIRNREERQTKSITDELLENDGILPSEKNSRFGMCVQTQANFGCECCEHKKDDEKKPAPKKVTISEQTEETSDKDKKTKKKLKKRQKKQSNEDSCSDSDTN